MKYKTFFGNAGQIVDTSFKSVQDTFSQQVYVFCISFNLLTLLLAFVDSVKPKP